MELSSWFFRSKWRTSLLELSSLASNGNASAALTVVDNVCRSVWLTRFKINPALNATAFAQEVIGADHAVAPSQSVAAFSSGVGFTAPEEERDER
jgi:hypothetical protein